jgi:hypothetical protein
MHGFIENSDPYSKDPFSGPSFHDHFGRELHWIGCGSSYSPRHSFLRR